MLKGFLHVNISVRDMDRSIQFYEDLGFKKVNDFTEGANIGAAVGFEVRKVRGVFMRLGDDPKAPFLDLVQWIDPPPQGEPYPALSNVGICRVAFRVDDIDKTYEDLKAKNVEFIAPLHRVRIEGSAGAHNLAVVMFKDPDGTVLQVMSGL